MIILSKLSTRGQVKSIMRLPCKSHPTTLRVEHELNAIKTAIAASKPSAETICNGLSQLAELYECMGDLLNLSTTRVLISRDQTKKWVEGLMEGYVNFLDVCDSTRDLVTLSKENIKDLHCALRRRKCENGIKKHNCFRNKMKTDVKMLIAGMKQVDNLITSGGSVVVDYDNHELVAVMKAVTGVNEMTVSVFESLFLYFCMPVSKPNRWSVMVSKLIRRGMVACEDQQEHNVMNEFECIDDALKFLCKNGLSTQEEMIQIAKCRLEKQETQLDCMETRLECIFRHLIGTRASLLNIISLENPKSRSKLLNWYQKVLANTRGWLSRIRQKAVALEHQIYGRVLVGDKSKSL